MAGTRLLSGYTAERIVCEFSDGLPTEPRIVTHLSGGTWEIPEQWFVEAGYELPVAEGTAVKAATPAPVGMVPRSLVRIEPVRQPNESA